MLCTASAFAPMPSGGFGLPPSGGFAEEWLAMEHAGPGRCAAMSPPRLPCSGPTLTVRCGNACAAFAVPTSGGEVHATSAQIAAQFGMAYGQFILRCTDGCVTPLAVHMPAGEYRLELPFGCSALGPTPSGNWRQPPIAFAMRPPSGSAEWLAIKLSANGQVTAATAHHVFSPAPAIVLTEAVACARRGTEQLALGKWQLWSPDWEDVSCFLHAGKPTLGRDALGRPQVQWPGMGITELSAAMRRGARGGEGWFHLSFALPAADDGSERWDPLMLCDGGGDEPSGPASKIIIRHSNSAKVGQWAQRGIGPYACHAQCWQSGSHCGAGGVLCRRVEG